MSRKRLWRVFVVMLLGASVKAATPVTSPIEDLILPSSLELERRVEPWCPGDCTVGVPFVASYRKGQYRLIFVGAHHAFRPDSPTMRVVKDGFAQIQPKVVILEGLPSAMGENPAPLVAEAHRYGTPEADDFVRGEGMYAASIALMRSIPFVGGEPEKETEIQVLEGKGYTDREIAFGSLLGWYCGARRAGDIPDTSLESLAKICQQLAASVRNQNSLEPPSLDEFRRRYRDLYGVDVIGDDKFTSRGDIGDLTRQGDQARASMMMRDRHLLELIEQQLEARRSVIVVYGGSHWADLSQALEKKLGKPHVRPFLN